MTYKEIRQKITTLDLSCSHIVTVNTRTRIRISAYGVSEFNTEDFAKVSKAFGDTTAQDFGPYQIDLLSITPYQYWSVES